MNGGDDSSIIEKYITDHCNGNLLVDADPSNPNERAESSGTVDDECPPHLTHRVKHDSLH